MLLETLHHSTCTHVGDLPDRCPGSLQGLVLVLAVCCDVFRYVPPDSARPGGNLRKAHKKHVYYLNDHCSPKVLDTKCCTIGNVLHYSYDIFITCSAFFAEFLKYLLHP